MRSIISVIIDSRKYSSGTYIYQISQDRMGRKILEVNNYTQGQELDIARFPAGIYTITGQSEKRVFRGKFVKE